MGFKLVVCYDKTINNVGGNIMACKNKKPTPAMCQEDRIKSLALMFASIHLGDSDCLGEAARELHEMLIDEGIELPEDFDC